MTTETADLELCRRAVAAGLVPRGLTPEQAYLSLLAGRELGLSDVQSLRLVQAIEGRIALTAQAMGGLLQRAGGSIIWHESTDELADVEVRFGGSVRRTRWTIEMAKRAGLAGRGTWQRYPMAMLSARALSDACRYAAPSVLAGVYDPEELASIEPQPAAPPVLPESRRVAYLRRLADLGLVEQAVAILGDPSTWTSETAARIGDVVKDLQATRAAAGGEE